MHNKTLLLLLLAMLLHLPCGMHASSETYAATTDDEPLMTLCWGDEIALKDIFFFTTMGESSKVRHFISVRYQYDATGNLQVLDTICRDRTGEEQFHAWIDNYTIKGNIAGKYKIMFFDWFEGETAIDTIDVQIIYDVIPAFYPGSIASGRDTMYMKNGEVRLSVQGLAPAHGGDEAVSYRWKRGMEDLYATGEHLVNYPLGYDDLTFPALVKIRRRAHDGSGCGNQLAEGVYSFVVFDSIYPGTLDEIENPNFCSVQTAQACTITASAAHGGTEQFTYQWFVQCDGTETAIAGATGKNLPLSLVTLEYGKHYTFVRKVKDDTRFTLLKPAHNPQTIYISAPQDEKRTREWVVCVPRLPYTVTWTDSKGNQFDHEIGNSPDDTWNVVDEYHPSGCTADTTLNIHVALDGYVLSKFDKILYVDESQAKQLHFKAFQWYKNGQAIAGATLNYYDEDGSMLDGLFEVEMTGEDGKTYRSCAVQMPQATGIGNLTDGGPLIYPVPAEAGMPVTITTYGGMVTIYSCTGEQIMQTSDMNEQLTIRAPQIRGVYYVQIQGKDGMRRTEKLLVK